MELPDARSQEVVPLPGRCVRQSHRVEFLAKVSVEIVLGQGELVENRSIIRVPGSHSGTDVVCGC